MDSKLDVLLKYISNLVYLPPGEAEKLEKVFTYKKILKNQMFLKANESLNDIGFNIKGAFRYFYLDYEGNDITKYFIVENDFLLSLSSFIDRSPALYSIQAIEDSEILTAAVEEVYDMIENNAYWKSIYMHILEKTYVYKEKREAEFLLYDAKIRYLNFLNEYPNINNKVKKHHIASYLGITAESLSRIRSQGEKY